MGYRPDVQQRPSWLWIVVGTFAVIGGYWLGVRSLISLHVEGAWLAYAAHAVGAVVAGAMMVAHAPLRPWREPVIAGVLATAVLALLFIALPAATFGWVAKRSDSPWLVATAIAGLSAIGALGGATIARRFTSTTPSVASMLVLSAIVVTGAAVTASHLVVGTGIAGGSKGLFAAAAVVGMVLGGFLTQMMVPLYRPWLTGGGSVLFTLVMFADRDAQTNVGSLIVGVMTLTLFGVVGARLAKRFVPAAAPALPVTQLH
jgi:hypothetical protein